MALDAKVWCNCFERGNLRSPPPPGCQLSVYDDGSLGCGSDVFDVQIAFDRWRESEACEHEDCTLVAHRIGNIALVAFLRETLQHWPDRFPIILSRVIYDGVHGGDFIPAIEIPKLVPEVEALAEVHRSDLEDQQFLREFEAQMRELVAAALSVGKPISF